MSSLSFTLRPSGFAAKSPSVVWELLYCQSVFHATSGNLIAGLRNFWHTLFLLTSGCGYLA